MSTAFKTTFNPDHNAFFHAEFCRQIRLRSAFGELSSIHLELLVLVGVEVVLLSVKQLAVLMAECFTLPCFVDDAHQRALVVEEVEVCHQCLLSGHPVETMDDSGLCDECLVDTMYQCREYPVFKGGAREQGR